MIKSAINDNDFKQAALVAHSLKGVSANIGADFVRENAELIEDILLKKAEDGIEIDPEKLNSLLIECAHNVDKMVNTIHSALDSYEDSLNVVKSFDRNAVELLVEKLKAQLTSFDIEAIDTLYQILEYLAPESRPEITNKLISVLETYDYIDAGKLLEEFDSQLAMLSSESGKAKIDNDELRHKLEVLLAQVRQFDSTAVDLVDDLFTFELKKEVLDDLERVRSSLGQYDFSAGSKGIEKIIAAHL